MPNLEPVSFSMSSSVASWPEYRFLKRYGRCSGTPISLSIFQFVMIHTVKSFSIVSEAEVDVFLGCLCLLHNPTNVGNLISVSSACLSPVCISWSSQFTYCWSLLKDFEHYFTSMWNECNCMIVWTFFGIALWFWDENWPFPILCPLLSGEYETWEGLGRKGRFGGGSGVKKGIDRKKK